MRTDDHAVALWIAREAGETLLKVRRACDIEGDATSLCDQGDRIAHHLIVDMLATLRPGDAVLSEEGVDDAARLGSERVWIVDPLDGTREFGELPRTDWAVHVALWERGALAAGAVVLPARGVAYSTAQPPPAPQPSDRPVRIAVSRSRPPELACELASALHGELVPMGSAGVKAMAVVTGEADVYVHAGGQYEWDSAAPVAVARSAGVHVSRIDGAPLMYNRADAWLPDLLVCRADLAGRVLDLIAAAVAA